MLSLFLYLYIMKSAIMKNKILEVKKVSKTYKSFKLDKVSFDIEEGSICGFIGRNGAGKTTTLKGIIGLLHFDEGEVKVFGRDFRVYELVDKQDVSFSLSEINFFPDMRIGKLTRVTSRFYYNWNQETYLKLCKRFGIEQNKRIRELSSGMKVKYNLAVALSHGAKLLILDEPTSGLDPISRDEVLDLFKLVVKDGTRSILFSTHITSDLEKCADHIVYIKKGKISSSSTKEDFLNEYRYVEGSIEDLEKCQKYLVNFKSDKKKFTGLVKTKLASKLPSSVKQSKPNLEQVMIYEEREVEEDEELIL